MYTLDIFNNPEPLSIYLARVDGTVLGCIDNIVDQKSASLHISLKKQYELEFDVYNIDGEQNYFEHLVEGMYLYIKDVGLFKTENPTIYNDGEKERKTIKAYSIDSELEDKTINISVNTGKKESQEYLVTYDSGETENLVNPYTGIPYDWIVLYNTFPEQLVALNAKVRDGYFGTEDVSGNIVVTDSAKITELKSIFDTIPRLLNKITFVDNQDGSKDSVLTEYVIIEYDTTDTDVIISYTLTSDFRDRISSLTNYYTKYRDQLSLLSLVLNQVGGGWGIGTICGVPFTTYSDDENYLSLCNKKFKFEINETVYSFFTQTFSKKSECVVTFDTSHRKVNITPVADIGEDTGIIIGYDTLVKSLNISTDEDKLTTRLFVTGGDDLSIRQANFGSNYIDLLAYKMNVRDSNGQRIYVSDNLAEKYLTYYDYRENLRENYVELAKQYEENLVSINELNYRVPNDGLKTDYGTFTLDELKTALTHYKNLQVTLISLYKEDYGTAGLNQDGSVNENYIKTTEYWWDYEAYKNIIIEIECAIAVFPYYDDSTKWTPAQIAQYKDQIKAWETEWSLFGIRELEAKIATYEQNMNLMLAEQDSKSAVIKKNDGSDWNIKTWAELTDDEKSQYGNSSGLYRYSIYMDYYNNMVSAKTYLVTLQTELATLEAAQENIQSQMSNIVNQVDINTYFTSDETRIIFRMFRDSDYNNDNIIVTSIDTTAEKLDKMVELIEDAKEQLSKYSRPQLIFSVEADNLFALNEFQPFWNSFKVGNYISVQYQDDSFTEVRLIGYTCNPCLPSANDLRVEFSNFIQSRTGYNDWADLLGTESGGGSRGSSSGSSSGSGLLDDIDETISNTMLSKLLNSEVFGTRVTNVILDTIDANTLTARMATFGGLADGSTLIDGKCIQTGYIIDENYAGYTHAGDIDNTAGTIINLETGEFNFGGGKLVYDGNDLTVSGTIIADAGQIGDFTLDNGALYTGQKTTDGTNVTGVRLSANELNLSGGTTATTVKLGRGVLNIGGELTYDATNGLVLEGNLTAENGTITGASLRGNEISIIAKPDTPIADIEMGLKADITNGYEVYWHGYYDSPYTNEIYSYIMLDEEQLKLSMYKEGSPSYTSSITMYPNYIRACTDVSYSKSFSFSDLNSITGINLSSIASDANVSVVEKMGWCILSGKITLSTTVNDWTPIITNIDEASWTTESQINLPPLQGVSNIYFTVGGWNSSYKRGTRFALYKNSLGNTTLSVTYGDAYECRFLITYPCDTYITPANVI